MVLRLGHSRAARSDPFRCYFPKAIYSGTYSPVFPLSNLQRIPWSRVAQFRVTTISLRHQKNTTTFTLFNLYSPGRPEPLTSIINTIQLPKNCVLMGDFNAHHVWWQGTLPQSTCTSAATHSIVDWLGNNNFHLLNKPGKPTHHPRNGGNPSTIDLCFSCGSITQALQALAIDHDTTLDHSSITITLSLLSSHPTTPP